MELPDGSIVVSRIEIVRYVMPDGVADYAIDVDDNQTNGETKLLLTFGEWWLIEELVRGVMRGDE